MNFKVSSKITPEANLISTSGSPKTIAHCPIYFEIF